MLRPQSRETTPSVGFVGQAPKPGAATTGDAECALKLDDQMCLAYESQRHLQSTRSLALQLQLDIFLARVCKCRPWNPAIHDTCETALKKCHAFDRFVGPDLRGPSGKAFVIRRLLQRPVHARRTDLQHIARS